MSETKRMAGSRSQGEAGAAGMEPKVFRSAGARIAGWTWLVFAAANLADIAFRGRDLASLIAAAVLLTGCGLAYVLGLRPAIIADETGVWLRNPLRDVRIPWRAFKRIEVAETLRFHCVAGGRPWQAKAWTLQTSHRARARAARRAEKPGVPDAIAEHVKGRTPADFAAEQLTELAAARGGGGPAGKAGRSGNAGPAGDVPPPTTAWSIPAVVALALPGAVLVALILVGSLS